VIFVDTSFFYALFTQEDDNHQRAVEAFTELEGRRLSELLLSPRITLSSKRSRSRA